MTRARRALSIAAVLLGCSAGAPVLAQSNIGFLRDSPVAQFDEKDFSLMRDAAAAVIETREPGATKTWANSASGHSGSIQLLQSFQAKDGRDCRRLRVETRAKSIEGASTLNVCRGADGRWLLDASAKPAPPP